MHTFVASSKQSQESLKANPWSKIRLRFTRLIQSFPMRRIASIVENALDLDVSAQPQTII